MIKKKACKISIPKIRKNIIKKWKEKWENFPQNKFQKFVACIPYHLQIIRFLKSYNKYRKGRIDKKK